MDIIAIPALSPKIRKGQNGRLIKTPGEPAFTLTSVDDHGIFDGKRYRGYTSTEKERLQGLPDGWTIGVSRSQRGKILGNAVSVPVIEYIGRQIVTAFSKRVRIEEK